MLKPAKRRRANRFAQRHIELHQRLAPLLTPGVKRQLRRAMNRLVESGASPGLLAYIGKEPVGWCAVAPRSHYPGLERSRILKPVDQQLVWSVSCLFVTKPYRRTGVSVALLNAAVVHVHSQAGHIVEGYPQEPKTGVMPDVFAWTGLVSAFRKVGFKEVARPTPTRPIMRHGIHT